MFIELTDISGVKFLFNVSHIINVSPYGDGADVVYPNGIHEVVESYKEVKDKIEYAYEIKAQRGYRDGSK